VLSLHFKLLALLHELLLLLLRYGRLLLQLLQRLVLLALRRWRQLSYGHDGWVRGRWRGHGKLRRLRRKLRVDVRLVLSRRRWWRKLLLRHPDHVEYGRVVRRTRGGHGHRGRDAGRWLGKRVTLLDVQLLTKGARQFIVPFLRRKSK
jgi:hypothetical protein